MMQKNRKETMDGNTAAAMASYYFTEVAAIYPITPSSPMAEAVDKWASQGKKNIFGRPVRLIEILAASGHPVSTAGIQSHSSTTDQASRRSASSRRNRCSTFDQKHSAE